MAEVLAVPFSQAVFRIGPKCRQQRVSIGGRGGFFFATPKMWQIKKCLSTNSVAVGRFTGECA